MKYRLLTALLTVCALTATHEAAADFTGSRATPRQVQLVGSGANTISVTWQVTATADHRSGASSAGGDIIDPSSGEILLRVNRALNAAGAGPFMIRETLTLDAGIVRGWIERGTTTVILQRTFIDAAGSSTSASVVLVLNRSKLLVARRTTQGSFSVQTLRLEFDSGNNTEIVTVDESMRASLTVSYSGKGMLRGRWQIAEPGSSEGAPLYRTLSLVNTNLTTSQRSTLRSPALPTGRSGKYLLRFCVTNGFDIDPGDDPLCPNQDLTAMATYLVQGVDASSVEKIEGLSPNRQSVTGTSNFSWRPLSEARVYQLQIFALGPADGDLPSSRIDSANVEPQFITGMLLKAANTNTLLSESVLSKLQAGQRYLWRVTAHDESGRMIGQSAESSFVFE